MHAENLSRMLDPIFSIKKKYGRQTKNIHDANGAGTREKFQSLNNS